MRRFVILGTPRSASTYIYEVFNALGIKTGHENIFNVWGKTYENFNGWTDMSYIGVAGFSCMPFVPFEDVLIFHQARDKQKVMDSFKRLNYLHKFNGIGKQDFHFFLNHHCDGKLIKERDYDDRLSLFYDIWNAKCKEKAELSYMVEELDLGTMRYMIDRIGADVTNAQIESVLMTTPKDVNTANYMIENYGDIYA